MKTKLFATAAGAMALALALWITPVTQGQPMYDRIKVNLPYSITLGDKVLQPGEYTIQQLQDLGGGSRVLLFYTDHGMKFETSAMTIPTLDPNTPRDTKLVLNRVGDDYYIHKIWVQGKDYGYELPEPKSLRLREKETMTQTTVAATYTPSATTETTTTTAETTPPPVTSETKTETQTETLAENTQATHPTESETPNPPVTTTVTEETTANRSAEETPAPAPRNMPSTAANWVMMLLSGGTLSGAGLFLRRKR